MLLYLLLLIPLCSSINVTDPNYVGDVFVELPQGYLQGFRVDYGSNKTNLFYGAADIFLGLPYAEPPVGPLRFQKPKPLCSFPGAAPYDGTYAAHACPQDGYANNSMSEDCLYVNVFSPNVNANTKAPVMIWIHGGSMKSGSAKEFPYKGAVRNLVSRGVVVVVIQYRLGMLGFFTTHTDAFAPNLAMLDQVEAIRWVKKNIEYFGGDPFRITLFGQSAGAASVSAHTYSPLSQNLFQSVIMESGVALTCFEGSLGFTNMSFLRAQAICNTTQAQWNSNDFTAMTSCLMNADYHSWLPMDSSFQDVMGWKMSQDNYFMPGIPSDLSANRPNIPVMIGSMLNEYSLFDLSFLSSGVPIDYYGKQGFQEEFQLFTGFIGTEQNNVMNIMENVYTPPGTADDDHVAWLQINDRALTCAGFTGFIGQEIDNYLSRSNPDVYLYQMVYPPNVGIPPYKVPGWSPVPHQSEVPYVWLQENYWNDALKQGTVTASDYALLDWFGETWTNFAKYGFPRRSGDWVPLSTRGVLNYYEINVQQNVMRSNYRLVDQTVWNQVVPVLAGPMPPRRPDFNNGSNFENIREQYRQSLLDVCPITIATTVRNTNPTTPITTSNYVQTTTAVPQTNAILTTPTTTTTTTTTVRPIITTTKSSNGFLAINTFICGIVYVML